MLLLLPANKVCEGYVFTRVCLSTGECLVPGGAWSCGGAWSWGCLVLGSGLVPGCQFPGMPGPGG